MGLTFRVFGIPVRVHLFFFLIAVYFGLGMAGQAADWLVRLVIFIAIMFGGVLLHELGHALMGRAFGLSPQIELHGLGGLTSWVEGRRLSPGKSILVSLAGPFVGIAVGGACLALAFVLSVGADELTTRQNSLLDFTLQAAIFVNLLWGALNLLPILPLDGGNVLASAFERFFGLKGRLGARYVSLGLILALFATIFFFARGFLSVWNALILGLIFFENFRGLRVEQQIVREGDALPFVHTAQRAFEKRDGQAMLAAAQEVIARARSPRLRAEGSRLAAWAHLLVGDARAAQRAINELPSNVSAGPLLQGAVLLELGVPARALPLLEQAAVAGRGGDIADNALVRAYRETRDWDRAKDLVTSPDGAHLESDLVEELEQLAYEAGRFDVAAALGVALFEREGQGLRAFNAACSYARAGAVHDALAYLEKAVEAGLPRPEILDEDEDLASLRADPRFAQIRAQATR